MFRGLFVCFFSMFVVLKQMIERKLQDSAEQVRCLGLLGYLKEKNMEKEIANRASWLSKRTKIGIREPSNRFLHSNEWEGEASKNNSNNGYVNSL